MSPRAREVGRDVARRFVSADAPDLGRAGAGGRPCQGVWHRPARGDRPEVAFVATHYEVDFSEHYLADPLARRGLGFLGWNTRYRGQGAYFRLSAALADIGVGVRWLREQAGAGTVVLLGRAGAWDRIFAVPRTWADLRFLDLTLDPSERAVGCYPGDPRAANYGPAGLAAACTLRGWLEMWSLEASDCRAGPHLARITQPALVVQSSADQGCHLSDAGAIHDGLGSADRTLVSVPGDHYLLHPAGAREQVADLIASWVGERTGRGRWPHRAVSPAG